MSDFLVALKGRVAGLSGWRRRAAAAGFGVLAAAALPPLHLVVLLVPAFMGLLWLTEGTRRWSTTFAVGWWFGFGHFVAGLYWIAFALLVEADKFAWMIPFAVFGLAAIMAVFPGLSVLATRISRTRNIARVLTIGVAWTAFEWLRGWAFTGFSWNLIGTVWTFSDAMLQVAAAAGVLGLGLLTVIVAAMPAVLADENGRRPIAAVALAGLVLAAVWGAGAARLATAADDVVGGVRLRLVQANIPQELKWRPGLRRHHLEQQLRMSVADPAPGQAPPTHVIWGETMVPFALANDAKALELIGRATPPGGVTIAGAPRITAPGEKPYRVWNSLHAVDHGGRVVGTYDKAHLVPFGEYVPFSRFLPIAKVTQGGTGFSAGAGPTTLSVPGLPPVSPLICYEVIFPGRVTAPGTRPRWLLNLTNDSWFGRSSGPYQHLAAARLRAVEEGLPLVRVANSGISAIIDPYGRTVASLELGRQGVIDGDLPAALVQPTPFARLGNVVFMLLSIALILVALLMPAGILAPNDIKH
ncbi:MAG: apolipoprotein N-acyltransferase [Rhodospirillales bacterium]|jgi:apolipoprotein N-acyltransferase|nr:apolipoprotein N-acyltransferase [Rhodospirillales bacterium]